MVPTALCWGLSATELHTASGFAEREQTRACAPGGERDFSGVVLFGMCQTLGLSHRSQPGPGSAGAVRTDVPRELP